MLKIYFCGKKYYGISSQHCKITWNEIGRINSNNSKSLIWRKKMHFSFLLRFFIWTTFQKSLLNFLQFCFCFVLLLLLLIFGHEAHGIEPTTPFTGRWSLSHWATREVPRVNFSYFLLWFCLTFSAVNYI